MRRGILSAERGFPARQPRGALGKTDKCSIKMLGYTLHIVGLSKRQASTEDEIRDTAFESVPSVGNEIRILNQVEVDLDAELFVPLSSRYLTEPSADESRPVMGSGRLPIRLP